MPNKLIILVMCSLFWISSCIPVAYQPLYGTWECDDGSVFGFTEIFDGGFIFGLNGEYIETAGTLHGQIDNVHCHGFIDDDFMVITNTHDDVFVHDVAVYYLNEVYRGCMEGIVYKQNVYLTKGEIFEEECVCFRED